MTTTPELHKEDMLCLVDSRSVKPHKMQEMQDPFLIALFQTINLKFSYCRTNEIGADRTGKVPSPNNEDLLHTLIHENVCAVH